MKKRVLKYTLLVWILCVFIAVGIFFGVRQYFEIRTLKKTLTESVDAVKTAKERVIKRKRAEISQLKRDNRLKDINIAKAKQKIDSLENREVKIKIIYKDRIEKIKGFDSKDLENYWKDEFK